MDKEILRKTSSFHWSTYRDGSRDSLLVAPQALALLPAHGLQHLVADVVARQAVLRGLLVVPARSTD